MRKSCIEDLIANINETNAGRLEDHELTRNNSSFLLLEVLTRISHQDGGAQPIAASLRTVMRNAD